ncbi:MAG: redoxin domain-containing protein [Planctomycetes bacterium]|nr:redoxin domain-containing protein [Planctomycetota bacterium]
MTLRPIAALIVLVASAALALAQRPGDSPPPREGTGGKPVDVKPVDAKPSNQKQTPIALGATVDPKLGWIDADGKAVTLAEFEKRIVVLYFVGKQSAASAAWAKRFQKLAELYADAGLVLVAIDANADDLADASKVGRGALAKWAKDAGFARFGLDPERVLADRLSVATNGHVVVLDAQRTFAFSGTLDDDFKGADEARALRFVRPALDAIVAGRKPDRASTQPLGDPIVREVKRPEPAPTPPERKPEAKRPRS